MAGFGEFAATTADLDACAPFLGKYPLGAGCLQSCPNYPTAHLWRENWIQGLQLDIQVAQAGFHKAVSIFKTVPMDIPEELAPAIRRQVGEYLERKHDELAAALDAVKTSRKAFKAQAGANIGETAQSGKRFSKAEAKSAIMADLQRLNGAGSLINEIAVRTGIPYGTVHRAMTELLDDGEVEKGEDNRVRLKDDNILNV